MDQHLASKFKPFILASQSPRRKELLEVAGYDFRIIRPSDGAECGMCSGESPPDLVARLAYQKAKDVALRVGDGMILGADTVAECHGNILGKPKDENHAREMLTLMSGRDHAVYSGVCLWHRPSDKRLVEVEVTRLRMDKLSDDMLATYLATDAWQGKAGAFGYQDGLDWVHITEGSESNVVGLPMERLASMLERFETEAASS